MTRDEAVARIKQGLGFRTDRTTECEAMLREAQRFFEKGKTLPWFLIEEGTFVTVADTATVSLPTGFIREVECRYVYRTDSDGVKHKLTKKSFAAAFDAYSEEDSTAPEVYALRASDLMLFPTPDAVYTFNFPYYKAADVLSGNTENVWLANVPELLIGEAGFRLAADMRDSRAIKEVFDPMRKQAWDAVWRETVAREEANLHQSFGSDL